MQEISTFLLVLNVMTVLLEYIDLFVLLYVIF